MKGNLCIILRVVCCLAVDNHSYEEEEHQQVKEEEEEHEQEEEEEEECWEDCEEHSFVFSSNGGPNHSNLAQATQETKVNLLSWILLFILRLQAKHYIPDVAVKSLLTLMYIFLSILGRKSDYVAGIAAIFPTS